MSTTFRQHRRRHGEGMARAWMPELRQRRSSCPMPELRQRRSSCPCLQSIQPRREKVTRALKAHEIPCLWEQRRNLKGISRVGDAGWRHAARVSVRADF
jgi:hypothetical protein